LRQRTEIPIAVGFGIKDRNHIDTLREVGADAAIVGSVGVACVERAILAHSDVLKEIRALLLTLGWPVP
jgi:tryptophan synthase alpha chain